MAAMTELVTREVNGPGDAWALLGLVAGGWQIIILEVPAEARGHGHGTALLKRICREADAAGDELTLLPLGETAEETMTLRAWYRRFGFADGAANSWGMAAMRRPAKVGSR